MNNSPYGGIRGIKMKTLTKLDLLQIKGKKGFFICLQEMEKFYDCANGYQEHCAHIQPYDLNLGIVGNMTALYHSEMSKVSILTDVEILALSN
jgi:hypothetical protein